MARKYRSLFLYGTPMVWGENLFEDQHSFRWHSTFEEALDHLTAARRDASMVWGEDLDFRCEIVEVDPDDMERNFQDIMESSPLCWGEGLMRITSRDGEVVAERIEIGDRIWKLTQIA